VAGADGARVSTGSGARQQSDEIQSVTDEPALPHPVKPAATQSATSAPAANVLVVSPHPQELRTSVCERPRPSAAQQVSQVRLRYETSVGCGSQANAAAPSVDAALNLGNASRMPWTRQTWTTIGTVALFIAAFSMLWLEVGRLPTLIVGLLFTRWLYKVALR
jgi:hypothetical protein